ncbi:hypothetical protein J6590_054119 [Homalodisca vitripennis]|nr:hypothetical protein J6590_054119 [Homalodisca vitripennis]
MFPVSHCYRVDFEPSLSLGNLVPSFTWFGYPPPESQPLFHSSAPPSPSPSSPGPSPTLKIYSYIFFRYKPLPVSGLLNNILSRSCKTLVLNSSPSRQAAMPSLNL